MLVVFSLYDETDTYSESFIENYAKINLIPQVQRVQGVGDANVLGQDYSMRIWLRPDVMAQYKLVPGDVSAALAEQNVEAAPGQFGERSDQTSNIPSVIKDACNSLKSLKISLSNLFLTVKYSV